MVKAYELRSMEKDSLLKALNEHRKELSDLAVAKVTNAAPAKLAKIKSVRKSIARILTVYNQKQKEGLIAASKGQKYLPKQLRAKKTRAMRRALSKAELSRKTVRQAKKDRAYGNTRYAVKA
mmetsp:Transcript_11203/g.14643  ORF Transcript_11203/g.14643 Transcript_11203/m.14643 type:complete len:122 (+) Transcript_11203:71-436(+)